MKILRALEIEKAASQDASRHALQSTYLTGSTLTATDGKIMVRVPVEREPSDCDGHVPIDAIKAARKLAKRDQPAAIMLHETAAAVADGRTWPKATTQWPNCDQVWDRAMKSTGKIKIAFDVRLLERITDAMGCDMVMLEITSENDPIKVFPRGRDMACKEAAAVLMPVRLEEGK